MREVKEAKTNKMDTETEFKSIKQIVENILKEDERARNSDKWLIIETLRGMGFKIFIDYRELENMPSFETITRCRRKINEELKYLPNENIQRFRDHRQEEIKEIARRY